MRLAMMMVMLAVVSGNNGGFVDHYCCSSVRPSQCRGPETTRAVSVCAHTPMSEIIQGLTLPKG